MPKQQLTHYRGVELKVLWGDHFVGWERNAEQMLLALDSHVDNDHPKPLRICEGSYEFLCEVLDDRAANIVEIAHLSLANHLPVSQLGDLADA